MTEPDAIFMFGLMFLGISLMGLSYMFKKPPFAFAAVAPWVLLAVFAYGLSAGPWDVYYALFWFSIGFMLVSVLEAMTITVRDKEEPKEQVQDSVDRYLVSIEKQREKQERYRQALGGETTEERRERKRKELLRR